MLTPASQNHFTYVSRLISLTPWRLLNLPSQLLPIYTTALFHYTLPVADNQMNDYLSKQDYFSGTNQPGIGDFMMLIPLVQLMPLAMQQGDGPTETPRGNLEIGQGLRGWWKRVQAR